MFLDGCCNLLGKMPWDYIFSFCWIAGHDYVLYIFPADCLQGSDKAKYPNGKQIANCRYCRRNIETDLPT
jgi:hypothetical protein